VLPKPLRASASRAQPRINRTHLKPPDQTCSRENSREGEPSVLPSAVLAFAEPAAPEPIRPILTAPKPALPRLIYPPKRAAEGAEAPSAAVCSGCPAL